MKTQIRFVIGVCLLTLPLFAQEGGNSYIGVVLDSEPLPPLLVKHLQLEPEQGLRIRNLHRGGPADQAGLERDDIITRLNGDPVVEFRAFAETIAMTAPGKTITLEIIHLGQRRNVEITLEEKSDRFDPKYPREPDAVHSWQPGKMFRFDPTEDHWIEVNVDPHASIHFHDSLSEQYEFHYSDGDHPMSVSIKGDPHEGDSTVTCKGMGKTFTTTVDEIDNLPAEFRETAERALKEARKESRGKRRSKVIRDYSVALRDLAKEHPPEEWREYTEDLLDNMKYFMDKHELPKQFQELKDSQSDRLKGIEEKLDQLYRRFDQLEKHWRETESEEKGDIKIESRGPILPRSEPQEIEVFKQPEAKVMRLEKVSA